MDSPSPIETSTIPADRLHGDMWLRGITLRGRSASHLDDGRLGAHGRVRTTLICPACGQRSPVGSRECRKCRYPFTRQAFAANAESLPRFRQPAQRHRSQTPRGNRESRGRSGAITALWALVLVVAIAVGLTLAGLLLSNTVVKPIVGRQVSSQLDQSIRETVSTQIADQPAAGRGSEPQEITITEADLNARIQENGGFGPLDDLSVDVTNGGVIIDLKAYGLNGQYHADLVTEGGVVRLENGSMSGPLSLVMPTGELESTANTALAGALSESGYQIAQVMLGNDELVIVTQ